MSSQFAATFQLPLAVPTHFTLSPAGGLNGGGKGGGSAACCCKLACDGGLEADDGPLEDGGWELLAGDCELLVCGELVACELFVGELVVCAFPET